MIPELLAHPLTFNILVLVASLYILFKSADLIIYGITNYARKLGLSDALIGLVVIAIAASAPEVISALTGFMTGNASIGLGAVFGNNLVHAGLAMGLVAVVGKKVKLEENIFTKQRFLMWISLMLPFLLALDGDLDRPDGAILLIMFTAYLIRLWQIEGTLGKLKKNVKLKHLWRDSAIFLGCLVALILSGRYLVFSSVNIAHYFNISPYFIALTIIGIGTTLPDVVIMLKSVIKKHENLGTGDLLGSLTMELVFFLGLMALIKPIPINLIESLNAMFWLVSAITLIMIVLKRRTITWKHGLALLAMFAAFFVIELFQL